MSDETMFVLAVLAMSVMIKSGKRDVPWGGGWVWPLPDIVRTSLGMPIEVVPAVVSQEFRGGGARPHYGVDLMYQRTVRGQRQYWVPDGVPVLAARDGVLWSVERTARGWAVVIDHGPPFATFYTHLAVVDQDIANGVQGVRRNGEPLPIAAGRRLGLVGYDPTDARKVRHLHFAVWYNGAGDAASVDPTSDMATWRRMQWTV
jgi:murein DD-endopeptidase MepM/ murein hydrolase activator NlpD